VLSLPIDLPTRPLLLNLTFGIVLFTLLVQGLTIEPLLRRLSIIRSDGREQAMRARGAQLIMLRAAWHELQQLADEAVLSQRAYVQFEAAYRAATQQLDAEIDELHRDQARAGSEGLRAIHVRLLRVEQATLHELQRQELIDGESARKIAEVVDSRLLAIESGAEPLPDSDDTTPLSEQTIV
jgi:Na+:H+ antiporter